MTTPNHDAPEGAFVEGSQYGQDITAGTVQNLQTQAVRDVFNMAVSGFFENFFRRIAATRADLADGQNQHKARMDLLEGSSGYGTAVMSYSWNLPHATWVLLPFDTQLGPMKKVAVHKPAANSGWLEIKAGGLWRIDAHLTVSGYTIALTVVPSIYPPYFITQTSYGPILPQYQVQVVDKAGNLVTSREYKSATTLADSWGTGGVDFPQSSHFSHTFVADDMPDTAAPNASDHWLYVRVSVTYVYVNSGTFNGAVCKVFGGTKRSSLTASRWSRDAINAVVAPEVPDGGALT